MKLKSYFIEKLDSITKLNEANESFEKRKEKLQTKSNFYKDSSTVFQRHLNRSMNELHKRLDSS